MKERFDILVVDDEPVVIAAARRILEGEGFAVDEAADGDAAARRVEERAYALVLCDLMLPGVSGIELIAHVHTHLPGTPVVLITGYATLSVAVRAFREGAFDFIPKPFDFEELIGVVRRGLQFAAADPSRRTGISLDGLYALGEHVWTVPEEDGSARIGLGETFATLEDEIAEIELPNAGEDTLQGNCCARIVTASRSVYRVWAPLSGWVIETDRTVLEDAGRGGWNAACRKWVMRIAPSNLELELSNLTRR